MTALARLGSNSCFAELRFFVTRDHTFFCDVFLRLSAGGHVFPPTWLFTNLGEEQVKKHGLDPSEWWRGWDDEGRAYIEWIERALAGATSKLEPMEEYHFGVIVPAGGTMEDPPENRYFLFVIGIDRYGFVNDPEVCIGGETGPALSMSVNAVQLSTFRDEMLSELQPQWERFGGLEA